MIHKIILLTLIGLQAANVFPQTRFTNDIEINTTEQSISALKAGLTLGNNSKPKDYLSSNDLVIWEADHIYQNDIAGIGRDSALHFYQTKSNSSNEDALVRIMLSDENKRLTDQSFLVWGNNDAPLTLSKQGVPSKSIRERLMREWKVQNNGIARVNLSISLPDLYYSGDRLSDFELLITSEKSNFTNNSSVERIAADSLCYGVLYFKNLQFIKTQFFTLATNIQHKPEILIPQNFVAEIGHFYRKTFRVTDRDNDRVLLTLNQLPDWLSIINNRNGTYTIIGKPSITDKHSNILSFSLDDGLEIVDFSLEILIVDSIKNNQSDNF